MPDKVTHVDHAATCGFVDLVVLLGLLGLWWWKIEHEFGLPGWWVATLDGVHMARYDDLGGLIDRLEASYQLR